MEDLFDARRVRARAEAARRELLRRRLERNAARQETGREGARSPLRETDPPLGIPPDIWEAIRGK